MIKNTAFFLVSIATAITASASEPTGSALWMDHAISAIKEEAKVRDATWAQDISLWVSVVNDAGRRDGYAEYLCLVLDDAGRPVGHFVAVSVLDAAALAREERVEIGKAYCR